MHNNKQYGAVSLFIVVFSALLITVLTVSFVRIMLQDQQQASITDFSQSAYDSAQAGVEDAKRALVQYENSSSIDTSSWGSTCNAAVGSLSDIVETNNEVKVQTNSVDNLDQAYTCVKVTLDTPSYKGELAKDGYKLIPLKGVSSFDKVNIKWSTLSDIGATKFVLPAAVTLPSTASWSVATPPIIRAELIQFGSNGFTLNDFDSKDTVNARSNNDALFLYPSLVGSNSYSFYNNDIRRDVNNPGGNASFASVICKTNPSDYSCSTDITLPAPIGGGNRQSYLLLRSLYNSSKASYAVSLIDSSSGDTVDFKAVQPIIDSTGRTNNLFRRVQVSVEMSDISFYYPRAAVETTGNVCKNFWVTNSTADYGSPNDCTP